MRNGARLIIGSGSLVVIANSFISENAEILAFDEPANSGADATEPGSDGKDGFHGQRGGRVTMELGKLEVVQGSSELFLDLRGQKGGDGGNGSTGTKGATGNPGKEAIEGGYPDINGGGWRRTCDQSPTNGARGGTGNSGGNGGTGGNGGIGGAAIISIATEGASKVKIVDQKSEFGVLGKGGDGGEGGDGGAAGYKHKRNICARSADPGEPGPKGEPGEDGEDGIGGDAPRIVISDGGTQTILGRDLHS